MTELFKKYVEFMLGRWDDQKGLKQQFHAPLKDFILQQVAYRMHVNRTLFVSRQEFRTILSDLLGERGYTLETPEIEDELLHRSRLLITRGQEVGFSHLLLQEFFAGRAIPEDSVIEYIDDTWWTKPIVFSYGDRPNRATHLRSVQRTLLQRESHNVVSHRTVGIAMQASYLSVVKDRLAILVAMMRMFAEYIDTQMSRSDQTKRFPITELTFDYIQLRDSVPFSALSVPDVRRQIVDMIGNEPTSELGESMRFWFVIALLETGLVEEAAGVLEEYSFKESKYYFWICMGAFFIEEIVSVSQGQKGFPGSIRQKYMDLVESMRLEFIQEHRTLLLERRGDRVVKASDD